MVCGVNEARCWKTRGGFPRRGACTQSLKRLPEFHAEGARLIHEQSRPAGDFRGNRAIVPEIRELVGEILADERNLRGTVRESEPRIEEPIGAALTGIARVVVGAEAAADVGIVRARDHGPAAG